MKKINYLVATVIASAILPMSAGAETVIPVKYELRDSSSDSVDIKVESSGVKVGDVDQDGLPDIQAVGGRAELEKFLKVQSTTQSKDSDGSSERLLPTVNKKTDTSSQRVLPTVNKREAKVIVRGWDTEKKEEVANMEKNIKATAEADENIASIEIKPEKIEMQYRRPAKLFGFIPVAYYHAFTIDDKGNVAQGHPWWLAFAKDDADSFGSDAKYVFQNNQSDLRFIKMQTAIEQQVQRFNALSNVLKTRHEAAMNSIRNIK